MSRSIEIKNSAQAELRDQSMNPEHSSPPWSRSVKVSVAVTIALFTILVIWRFQSLLSSIIIAAIISYLLYPVIEFGHRTTRFSRGVITSVTYILLTMGFVGGFIYAGISAFRQISNLTESIPVVVEGIPVYLEQINTFLTTPRSIAGFELSFPALNFDVNNVEEITTFLSSYIQPIVQQVGSSIGTLALGTANTIGSLVIILFVSIYISNDSPKLREWVGDIAEFPGYRYDAERIWREFGRIWQAYLRGQAILAFVIGIVVYVSMFLLGVDNPLALGLISGLMEFIPFIGPLVGAGAAILVALFQASNYLGLTSFQFVIVVAIVMAIIQQIENNFLVPKIVGDALDLNPLIVFVGALAGTTFAGILGAILAAPVLATLKLLSRYAWRKMFDLEPFAAPEKIPEDEPSWAENAWEKWQLRRAGVTTEKSKEDKDSGEGRNE
ncbi:MAG: putative PurR-regulated permease PerM [Cellvibrionaceae bacterium]|jgi:predicted PurR-regulated permease PerM